MSTHIPNRGRPCPGFVYYAASFVIAHVVFWPVIVFTIDVLLLRYYNCWSFVIIKNIIYFIWSFVYHWNASTTGSTEIQGLPSWFLPCHDYFPVRMLVWDGRDFKSDPNEGHQRLFDANKERFIFGMHPHGPLPLGAALLKPQLSRWPFIAKHVLLGVADIIFWIPMIREFYLSFGSISVGKKSLLYNIERGKSIVLLPGGIEEQLTVCQPNEDVVVLNYRKGFVKVAMETGASLVPVYVFNERKAFVPQKLLTSCFSRILKYLCGMGVPCVRGRYFTLMPFAVPVTIVIGEPIVVAKMCSAEITERDVERIHAKYVHALEQLYAAHKDKCGHQDVKLVLR